MKCYRICKKRSKSIQSHDAVELGLRVTARSLDASAAVVTTVYRFCEVFGNEEAVKWVSFRQVAKMMLVTKELLGNKRIRSISNGIVSGYAQSTCAMTLQGIVELLRKCCAFSVAIDMAKNIAIG